MSRDADPPRQIPVGKVLVALVALGLLFSFGRQVAFLLPEFAAWVQALGALGPIVFILGYIGASVAFVPGSVLTLAAGAIFGLFWGTIYVMVGATLGATTAFLVSRYIARSSVEDRLVGNERFEAIDRAVGEEGFKIVFLLRLSPVFPFNVMNYALGLTNVRLVDFVAASIGMLPGTLLYIYYGKLAGDVAQIAAGGTVGQDTGYYAVLGLGLVATIVVATLVARTAQRALATSAAAVAPPQGEGR